VGAGISGLVAAYLLAPENDVVLFEASDRIGGHTHTERFELDGRRYAIDMGFIVFNDWTYPHFSRLLDRLGVSSQPTRMTFGFSDERTGLEYCASNPNTLFAQRRNLVRPSHYRMIAEIFRLGRSAEKILREEPETTTLGEYLEQNHYSKSFIEQFVKPMASAIWSADTRVVADFSLPFFLRFFMNHGMLNAFDQPTWRVVKGGSDVYVDALVRGFRDRIRLSTPVTRIRRLPDRVEVEAHATPAERFDRVIFACHSDQALGLLADPTPAEREILGAIHYQPNLAVLHTDERVLPRSRRAWAAWNYHALARGDGPVAVTYNMNRLQGISAPVTFCVTLNRPDAMEPSRVLRRIPFHHPVFSRIATAAQKRHGEIDGQNRTHYAGAYWGYGFHEDGVVSALRVARAFGAWLR
jgi:predicted NAD/FAD-binding protein